MAPISIWSQEISSSGMAFREARTEATGLRSMKSASDLETPKESSVEVRWERSVGRAHRDSPPERSTVDRQFSIVVVKILCKHSKPFEHYASDPALQPTPRRPLATGYKTKQFPLRTTTIDESSIHRNLAGPGNGDERRP